MSDGVSATELVWEQLSDLLKQEETEFRSPDEIPLEEAIGDIEVDVMHCCSRNGYEILTVYEDEEYAKQLESEQIYRINSDEFTVYKMYSFVPGGPEADVEVGIPPGWEHRSVVYDKSIPSDTTNQYECACGKAFDSGRELFFHIDKESKKARENQKRGRE